VSSRRTVKVAKEGRQTTKKIEQVVSAGATRRKRSLRKQFKETFVAGDARTAVKYYDVRGVAPCS
jgi:hypothetical protein